LGLVALMAALVYWGD